jgi:DAK2 domain fusion protein YloV
MIPAGRLGAPDLRRTMRMYAEALSTHQEAINRLNVYPVPDGDTGTNMALTVTSVVAALDELGEEDEPGMERTCQAISHGGLMGARGNSGLILSQVLRGMAEVLAQEGGPAGASAVGRALARGAEAAYGAVILTVARAAAEAASAAASAGLVGLLERAREEGAAALARTPKQLPALAQAGVVDAGGAGYLLLLDACLSALDGRPLPEAPALSGEVPVVAREASANPMHHDPVADLRYEVMYLLEAPEEAMAGFREVWAGLGDSIVVVGSGSLWSCHVHTDDIGGAIEAAMDVGRPRNIRVTDLMEEVEEERWVREAIASTAGGGAPPQHVATTGVVAVANGEGIKRIFRSLGVGQVVAGGQSMNPSTAELLSAVEGTPASEVVILPNNANIVPVAEQAARLSPKQVRVLPTRGIVEGFAALMEYDPEAGAEDNCRAMAEAAARVVTGEITRAVRSSACPAGPIAKGDWLGLRGGRIEVVESGGPADAACALLAKLCRDDHELVTLIEGQGTRPADTRRITGWLAEHRPRATAEVHHGGQPLYPYLISIE